MSLALTVYPELCQVLCLGDLTDNHQNPADGLSPSDRWNGWGSLLALARPAPQPALVLPLSISPTLMVNVILPRGMALKPSRFHALCQCHLIPGFHLFPPYHLFLHRLQ